MPKYCRFSCGACGLLHLQAEGGGYAGGCNIPDASINNPTYIFYNPTTNLVSQDVQFQPLVAAWPLNLYPFLTILPYSGSVFIITGAAQTCAECQIIAVTCVTAWTLCAQDIPLISQLPAAAHVADQARSYPNLMSGPHKHRHRLEVFLLLSQCSWGHYSDMSQGRILLPCSCFHNIHGEIALA